jgi:hypothetical protein
MLSIMTLQTVMLSVINAESFMLSVANKPFVLSVIMLSVVTLNGVVPFHRLAVLSTSKKITSPNLNGNLTLPNGSTKWRVDEMVIR